MTVKQLIARLSKFDPNRIVVMSKDGEGNGFSPLETMQEGIYRPESTWSGESFPEGATEDDYGYTKQKGDKPSVTLWPVN
jgi:hypothetical protein